MEGPGDDVLCTLKEGLRHLEQRLAQRRRGKLHSDAQARSKDDASTTSRSPIRKKTGPVKTLSPIKRINSGRQRRRHVDQDEVQDKDPDFEDVGIATFAGKQDRRQSHGACSRQSILSDSLHGQVQASLRLSSDSHLAQPHLTVTGYEQNAESGPQYERQTMSTGRSSATRQSRARMEGPGDDVLLALKEDFKRPEQRLALRHCGKLQSPLFNSLFHDIGAHGDVEHQGMVDENVRHVCLATSHESLPRASASTDTSASQGSIDHLATGVPACRNTPLQRAEEYCNAQQELLSLARAQGLTVLSPRSRAHELKEQSLLHSECQSSLTPSFSESFGVRTGACRELKGGGRTR
jgi:hypothetical protein